MIQFTQPKQANKRKFQQLTELSQNDPGKVISNFEQFTNSLSEFDAELFRRNSKRMNKEKQRCLFDVTLDQHFVGCCGYVSINKIDRESQLVFILFEENRPDLSSIFQKLFQETGEMIAMTTCKRVLCKIDSVNPNLQFLLALLLQSGFYRSATSHGIVTVVYEINEQHDRFAQSVASVDSALDALTVSSEGSHRLTSFEVMLDANDKSTLTTSDIPVQDSPPQHSMNAPSGRSFLRREHWPPIHSVVSGLNQPVVFRAPVGAVPPVTSSTLHSTAEDSVSACKYYPMGICMFGDNCKYRHDINVTENHEVYTKVTEEPSQALQATESLVSRTALFASTDEGSSLMTSPLLMSSSPHGSLLNPSLSATVLSAPMLPYSVYPSTSTMVSPLLMDSTTIPNKSFPVPRSTLPPLMTYRASHSYPGLSSLTPLPSPAAVINTLLAIAATAPRPSAQEVDFLSLINTAPTTWLSRVQLLQVTIDPTQPTQTLSKNSMFLASKAVDALISYRRQLQAGLTSLRQVAFIVGVTAVPAVSLEESLLYVNEELVHEYKTLAQHRSTAGSTTSINYNWRQQNHGYYDGSEGNTVPNEQSNLLSRAQVQNTNGREVTTAETQLEDIQHSSVDRKETRRKEKKQQSFMDPIRDIA